MKKVTLALVIIMVAIIAALFILPQIRMFNIQAAVATPTTYNTVTATVTATHNTVATATTATTPSIQLSNAVLDNGIDLLKNSVSTLKSVVDTIITSIFSASDVKSYIVLAIVFFLLGKFAAALVSIFKALMYILAVLCVIYAILIILNIQLF